MSNKLTQKKLDQIEEEYYRSLLGTSECSAARFDKMEKILLENRRLIITVEPGDSSAILKDDVDEEDAGDFPTVH